MFVSHACARNLNMTEISYYDSCQIAKQRFSTIVWEIVEENVINNDLLKIITSYPVWHVKLDSENLTETGIVAWQLVLEGNDKQMSLFMPFLVTKVKLYHYIQLLTITCFGIEATLRLQ